MVIRLSNKAIFISTFSHPDLGPISDFDRLIDYFNKRLDFVRFCLDHLKALTIAFWRFKQTRTKSNLC